MKKEDYPYLNKKIHITEDCGHEDDYYVYSMIPYHFNSFTFKIIKNKRNYFKRTFCPICMNYWDKEFKKKQ